MAQIARRSKVPVRMRRAIVVMASAQRQPVPTIAKLIQVSESCVRQSIHDFNEKVFDALDPKWSVELPPTNEPPLMNHADGERLRNRKAACRVALIVPTRPTPIIMRS